MLYNDINSFRKKNYRIYNAFLGLENFKEKKDFKFKNKIFNTNKIYNKNDFNKIKAIINEETKYLIELFTVEEKINSHQTSYFIVPGKFLNNIFLSLDRFKFDKLINNLNNKNKLEKKEIKIDSSKWNEDLLNELEKYEDDERLENLNTIIKEDENLSKEFNLLKQEYEKILFKKLIIDNKIYDDKNKTNEDEEYIEEGIDENIDIDSLVLQIILWHYDFIEKDYINSIAIYKILNKFFDNWNILENVADYYLVDLLQRTVLILINSVAIFENNSYKVSYYNFAVKDSSFILNNILIKTNASSLNIKPLVIEEKTTLTKALFFHPVIRKILLKKDLYKSLKESAKKLFNLSDREISTLNNTTKKKILKKLKKYLETNKFNSNEIEILKDIDFINKSLKDSNGKDEELKKLIEEVNQKLKENA